MVQQVNTFFFLSQTYKRKFSFHSWIYRELQVKKPHVKQWNLEKIVPVSWIMVKASRCDNQGGVGKTSWVVPPGHWGPVQPRWAMANGPFQRLWRTLLPSPPVTGRGRGCPWTRCPHSSSPLPPWFSLWKWKCHRISTLLVFVTFHSDTKICRSV